MKILRDKHEIRFSKENQCNSKKFKTRENFIFTNIVMSLVQSVLIPKDKYTIKQGQNWLRKHNYIFDNIDTTFPNYVHYRQVNPALLTKYSYITKVLPNGMQLAIAVPVKQQTKGGDLVKRAKLQAKKMNIPFQDIQLSTRPQKKLMMLTPDNKIVHFGDKNSISYLEKKDDKKRENYIKRHSKIFLKDGTRAIDKEYSPAQLSMLILWN
jgi:hypothetical protein